MNKQNTSRFLSYTLIVIGLHFTLISADVLKGAIKIAIVVDLLLIFLGIIGALILYTNDQNRESLAQRFIALTTVQMIGFLSVIAAFIYAKIDDVKYWAFTALLLFLSMLTVQTLLLLHSIRSDARKKSEEER